MVKKTLFLGSVKLCHRLQKKFQKRLQGFLGVFFFTCFSSSQSGFNDLSRRVQVFGRVFPSSRWGRRKLIQSPLFGDPSPAEFSLQVVVEHLDAVRVRACVHVRVCVCVGERVCSNICMKISFSSWPGTCLFLSLSPLSLVWLACLLSRTC